VILLVITAELASTPFIQHFPFFLTPKWHDIILYNDGCGICKKECPTEYLSWTPPSGSSSAATQNASHKAVEPAKKK
jgi:ferredoxin